jgi:hypothetical protein
MIGDWDLRTVSELTRYLDLPDESVSETIETPVWCPEQNADYMRAESLQRRDWIERLYIPYVRSKLEGKNCVILSSADVNPLTEVLLGEVYGKMTQARLDVFPDRPPRPTDIRSDMVVALKGVGGLALQRREDVGGHRLFFMPRADIPQNRRGFAIQNQLKLCDYTLEDEQTERCEVLGHLLLVYNPFSEGNRILVLNGASAIAPYGLIEMLTGGKDHGWESEQVLKRINQAWIDATSGENCREQQGEFIGIEALVSITIGPGERDRVSAGMPALSDCQKVMGWRLVTGPGLSNPRVLRERQ